MLLYNISARVYLKNNIAVVTVGRTAKPHGARYVTARDCVVLLVDRILSSFQQGYYFRFLICVFLNCFCLELLLFCDCYILFNHGGIDLGQFQSAVTSRLLLL